MSIQSMTDIAYEILDAENQPIVFKDLWMSVSSKLGLTNEQAMRKMSQFYTDLSLDGRFISKKDNKWELKKRLTFEETFIDTSAIEIDESELEDEFDDEEEAEDVPSSSEEY